MKQTIKDNINVAYLSISIILIGSICLSLVKPVTEEIIHETEILVAEEPSPSTEFIKRAEYDKLLAEVESLRSVINRVDKVEIDAEEPILQVIEQNDDGSSTITWPPKFRLNLRAPSAKE